MEIHELTKHVPNLSYILQNVCKTSISNFEELQNKELIDKQLLCWGNYSKVLKKVSGIVFYRHTFMGIVIYDKIHDIIFINKTSQKSYQLWKKSQLIKKTMKTS